MKNGQKRGFFLFAAFSLLLSLLSPLTTHAEEQVVTVGFIDYPGFIEESNGSYFGYGVDYLNQLSEYTGWTVQYVYGEWTDLMERVKTGEIDFICQAQKTEEREADYLFSKYSVGAESSILYTSIDNHRIYYNDYQVFNGMKVAMLSNSFQNQEFEEFAQLNSFTYEPVYYATDRDCFEALDAKEVDAVGVGSLGNVEGYKIIARFGSDPFFVITSKNNTDLIQAVDLAQGELMGSNPSFLSELYQKYFSTTSAASSLLFTREEEAYISEGNTILVGQLPNRYPISSLDSSGDTMSGINEDILAKISYLSGLHLISTPIDVDVKPMTALKEGSFDMVMGILDMPSFHEDKDVKISKPYMSSTMSVVLKKGEEFDANRSYKVAIKSSFQSLQEYIAQEYPQFEMQYYSSAEECLDAILKGEADLIMENVYVMNYLLQYPKYETLQILPTTFFQEEDCFAALQAADPRMISIIDKCINYLSEEDIDKIVLANTSAKPYQMTFSDVIYKFRVPILVVLALIGVVILLLGRIARIREKSLKEIEERNLRLDEQSQQLEEKNRALSEAVKDAEEANTAKSRFLSNMSHEIRTPMNAVVGLTTIARSHEHDAEVMDQYLTKIEASSKVLLNIINDVLDMSAIESQKLTIANTDFDLKQILNGISTIYYSQCKSKGIDFTMGVDVRDENLVGDSMRVNQVLMNLVSNAYKFTEDGGKISIDVKETERRTDNVWIRFTVADNGCGMSEEMQKRLFMPFEQESALTAQKHGGSGLGMSIAKNLVDLMHGSISVESEKGVGTTFTVDLPFACSEHATVIDPTQLKAMNALIVDDDETARKYTSIIVGRVGISFDLASSGEEAILKYEAKLKENKPYDIVFVDWRMPGINGVELTKYIRDHSDEKTTVVVVSAYDISEIQEEAKSVGADLFISKPLFQSTVFNTIVQITGGVIKATEEEVEQYDFQGHKLLLAEDNELNREIATDLLEMVNMGVDHAANGREAVDIFMACKPGTYDLILMDVQMPVMDGYEATKEIRAGARPDCATVPIYAMTANAFTEDISRSLSAGMNGHISKPIDTKILYQTIYRVLKQKEKDGVETKNA